MSKLVSGREYRLTASVKSNESEMLFISVEAIVGGRQEYLPGKVSKLI